MKLSTSTVQGESLPVILLVPPVNHLSGLLPENYKINLTYASFC